MNDITNDIREEVAQQLCARAEEKLKSTHFSNTADNENLYELYVHQIELEMQNEELRRAQRALEHSRDRYVDLYEFAPVGYFTLNIDGIIIEANFTAVTLFGVTRAKLLNRRFATYPIPEDKDRWHHHFMMCKRHNDKKSIELTLCRADGSLLIVQLDCLTVKQDDKLSLRITLIDITQRKQAEQQLRIAAVAFETQAGILITDAHKVVICANRAFTHITGYCAEEAIGRSPFFLRSGLHDEDFYTAIWVSIARDGYWQGEIWDKHKNGRIFPIWMTIATVTDSHLGITHYVGSFTDISVQKHAEKVLLEARQRLENQVVNTQEELEKTKDDSIRTNTALDVLLRYRETDKYEAQDTLSREVEVTIMPFLKKLKKNALTRDQAHLIDIIQNNLEQVVISYGRNNKLSSIYQKLTPTEIQVASMIRQGLSTKLIATTLQLSAGTVGIHRKNIRRKLALNGCNDSLYSYLAALDE
ncbi:MAG: PAS domain S-box protein [Methylococcales bacterium]|nr:PAS domain S-box protein [Methylococcales bacterium]